MVNRPRARSRALSLLVSAAACGPAPEEAPVVPEMDAVSLLTRASLDLRGVRPDPTEIETVEADPTRIDGLIDDFLADPRFEARVRDLLAPIWRTRIDFYTRSGAMYGVDDEPAFQASLGDEVLRLVGRVAAEDLPYTELVTGDWTMADENLARAWPVDYPDGANGWQKVYYMDGRPLAGVLSTNGLWWRYTSSETNYNRGRANAIARILLCSDSLTRPVEFDRVDDVLDDAGLLEATRSEPACVNCHASLDPLASHLYGFWYYNQVDVSESYHPERERLWESLTGVPPGFYGEPGYTLRGLGQQIAGDDRFVSCAVETVYEQLLQRETTFEDVAALTAHREAFLTGGLTVRAVVRSVLADPRYRSGETDIAGYVPLKMASPELLATQVEDLTGFRWVYAGYDLLTTDTYGLRTLAGGVDGQQVHSPARGPTASLALVVERLAEAAAAHVAEQDAGKDREDRRIFRSIDFTETPETGHDAMVEQVRDLHLRLYGHRVDAAGEEVQAALALWSELHAAERDAVGAWAGLLTFLMRDPDFVLY